MTPFKERMNLYRAYRELNPDKNYWDWKASIDNAGKLAQQFRTRTNKPNFVERLEDPNRQTIPSWEDDASVATHRLSYATYDDGSAVIYPEVQQIGNELYDFTDPTNRQTRRDAYQSALNRGDFVWVPTEQDAVDFTTQYKNHYPTFSKGSLEVPAMQGEGNTEDYQPTSEIPTYWDEESQSFKSGPPRVIGMSGTDPIGEAYVTGKAFTKALDIIGDAYRWRSRTDAVNNYRKWLKSSEWNRSDDLSAKLMRERLKNDYRKHGGDGGAISELANDIAKVVETGVKWGEKLLGFEAGGVVPAMQNGGENKPLQDPTIKTITFPDGSTVQTVLPWANQQGLLNTPIADMFNPANDVYDLVLVGKDATEGNWAGVGTGLVIAAMPKWMEKVGGVVKSGVKKLINKARNRDNVDWDEVVSGLAVPVKKDPMGVDAKPISDEIKVDDTHVAGLSGETALRYIDYGDLEYRDHIGYTRPQWLKDVLEFYDTDVVAREKNIATELGRIYHTPYDRSSMTLYSAHPTNVRLYLDDVNFAGYVHNDGIVIAKDSKLSPFLVMIHESGHIDQNDAYNKGVNYLGTWHDNEIDPIIPLTSSQLDINGGHPILTTEYVPEIKNVLDDAYRFTEEYLEKHPGIARSLEAGSTSRENRAGLWLAASKPSPAELDNIIDNMTDDDVLYLLAQGNGYSRDFYRSIKLRVEKGANLHELVEKVKYAMKYIPAFAAPAALAVPQMTNETKDKSN